MDALNGEIDWSFSGSEALFDHLDAGDTLVLNYTIILTDSANATISTTVTITIQGADDTPFIVAAGTTTEGEVTENGLDEDQAPVTGLGTATGTIVADDVDAGAVLEFSGNAEGSYGTFSVDAETGVWTYVLDQSAANNLAAGATETETFTVTVSDGVNSVTRNVTITINGTNDGPTIDFGEGEDQGSVEEDVTASASGTLGGGIDPDTGAVLTWSITNDSPYGTMSIDPDTSEWTFTLGAGAQALNEGDEVVHVFTATVTDEHGATASVPVTITITGTNDLPVVTTEEGGNVGEVEEPGERSVANGGTITGDLSVSGQLTATDADDGETATLVWSTTDAATYGTFTLNSNGSWTYTLDPALVNALAEGDTRTETFDIIVTDAVGGTSTETVTVTIQGTNDAPVINLATSQATGTVTEASIGDVAPVAPSTATGSLVATDVDAGDVLTWSVVGGGNGTYGTMSVSGATWTYTLDDMRPATQSLSDGDVRTDSFTLRVTDSAGVIRDITVAVTVNGRHEVFTGSSESEVISGTGNADSISGLGGDDTLSGGIGNDQIFGGDGDDSLVGGTGDDLLVGGTGSDIAEGLSGNDTLALEGDWDDYDITLVGSTYQFLNTVTGDLDRATLVEFVTFNGGPAVAIAATLNDAPVAVADSGVTTAEDTAVSISIATLLANDTDADILPSNPLGEALTLTSVTSGTGGTVAIVGTNVVFTPTTNYHGPASFTYTVTDVNGATTTGTVSLTVTPVNDAPVVADATASGTEDAAITGTVVGTDVDVEALTYALVAPVAGLTFNADGTWSYDPAAHQGLDTGESTTVTFQYVANDGTVNSAPATVTITVNGANDAPTGLATAELADGTEDTAYSVSLADLLDGFSDVDGDDLSVTGLTASNGTAVENEDGSWTITPTADFNGTVTLSYSVTDGTETIAGSLSYDLAPVNDAPDVVAPIPDQTVAEDTAFTFTVPSGTFGDPDGDALTYSLGAGSPTWLSIDGTSGQITGTPPADFTGDVAVTVIATDPSELSTSFTFTLTVTPVNDAPDVDVTLPPLGLAENAAAGTVAATLAVTDIDNDPGEMSLSLVGDAGGRFVLSGNDIVVADPVLLDFEQATSHDVTVQVSDGNGGVTTRTITINLTDVAPENVVGGAGSDRIVAATGADTLQGNGGNDTLVSGAGADLLDGGDGNDMLVGGAGGDSLIGGVGTRDQANYADATAGLRADLQVATFNTGFAAGDTYSGVEDLFGSALGDTLLGDSGSNIIWGDGGNDAFLDGRVGNDTIYGGSGNDVLIGGWGGDLLDGGTGSRDRAQYTDAATGLRADLQVTTFNTGIAAGDTYTGIEDLFGSFQSDSLLGNTEGNIIWGAAGNDLIDGRLGNDTLLGGAGNDTLVGGGGADVFIFETALGATNVDSIQGYSAVDDTIQLENAIFTALTETGVLAATAFVTGAAATSADHRIIYNSATGELLYDADGTGASGAVHFATLAPGLAITNSDFVVI